MNKKRIFDLGAAFASAASALGVYSAPPICVTEGHRLIKDNDGYLCRFCAKRFVEAEPATATATTTTEQPLGGFGAVEAAAGVAAAARSLGFLGAMEPNPIRRDIYTAALHLRMSTRDVWEKVKEYAITHPVDLATAARMAATAAEAGKPLPWESDEA